MESLNAEKEKKRILFFSDCFIYGGCEIVIANLMNSELIHQKYEVRYSYRYFRAYQEAVEKKIASKWHHCFLPQRLLSNGTIFYSLELQIKKKWLRILLKLPLFLMEKTRVYSLFNYFVLLSLFKKQKPDILFINNGGYPGSEICRLAVNVAKKAKVKKIIFNVNNIAFQAKSSSSLKENRKIGENVDCFVTASIAAKEALSQNAGFDSGKIRNIPNTVNRGFINIEAGKLKKEFHLKGNVLVLGSVGLLTKRKGFDVLIRAVAEVLKRSDVPDFTVFIFGEGEERQNLENLIRELGVKNVLLPGHREDILSYVTDFDIFVLPSIANEDMPYVIIEAMMLKKPIIGTNIAGIPEEVETGKTGFVVAPNDEKELASAIIQLSNKEELRKEFSEQGFKRYCDLFCYDIIVEKYLNLFKQV